MGIISSRIQENELLTELEHLKSREQTLRSENEKLKMEMKHILDPKNIDSFLWYHGNSILEDTFEKKYITKYHSYIQQQHQRNYT